MTTTRQQDVEFERLLADLSLRFVNLPPGEVDETIIDALRQIVVHLGVDRAQLIRLRGIHGDAEVTHSWAVAGVAAVLPVSLTERFPWLIQRLRAGLHGVLPSIDAMPPEAKVDQASFRLVGTKSNLTVPLKVGGKVEGILALGCLQRERDWSAAFVSRIGVLADVFANALAHQRSRSALDAACAFERTASDMLGGLLTCESSEQDRLIAAGLGRLAGVFNAERASLWQRFEEGGDFIKTHRWVADGALNAQDPLGAVGIPWIRAQLLRGKPVRFDSLADVPSGAAVDVDALRKLGVGGAIMVPLKLSAAVVGALSFATARANHEWPDDLISRVTLIADALASVLARRAAERRERDAQAQAAHAARIGTIGAVVASLVHELTQPLAASLTNAETAAQLLSAPSRDLDELRAVVDDIVANDRRAADLIQQLRRFLRRSEQERTEIDLRDVINDVVRLTASEAASKEVVVAVDIADSLPKVLADRVQMQQVLLNLLLNGFDAVAGNEPRDRRVTLEARPSDSGLTIRVSDVGCGMDERTRARIFEPFFTTKPTGMGLGLSISRTIVATHGGTMAAHSTLGQGMTFCIDLPSRPPDRAQPPAVVVPALTKGTVFVVDDDASMRLALQRQLTDAGHEVQTFSSAQCFLERKPHIGIACLVSDIRMPELSGLDLQASLVRAGRDLPIVFVSGHGDAPTTVHAIKAGAVNFLQKPFTRVELLIAVQQALEQSQELERVRQESAELRSCYELLTAREREVFGLVGEGLLNKVIADRLGAAEATIKIHRGRVMAKMKATSIAELVKMSERLGLQNVDRTQQIRAITRDSTH